MESFTEFYMNDLRYHASFHGVKMKPYISRDEIINKANRLDEIREEEEKQGKSLDAIYESIINKTYKQKS